MRTEPAGYRLFRKYHAAPLPLTVLAGLCGQIKDIELARTAAGYTVSAMTRNYPIKGRGAFAPHKRFRRRQDLGAGEIHCTAVGSFAALRM